MNHHIGPPDISESAAMDVVLDPNRRSIRLYEDAHDVPEDAVYVDKMTIEGSECQVYWSHSLREYSGVII